MNLKIDPNRRDKSIATGILVRAQDENGVWQNADISELTKESLLEWLRSRGGKNPWAENVIGLLLGHGNLVEEELGDREEERKEIKKNDQIEQLKERLKSAEHLLKKTYNIFVLASQGKQDEAKALLQSIDDEIAEYIVVHGLIDWEK